VIASISPWWAAPAIAVVLGALGVVLVLAGDDGERPVPQPPDPSRPVLERTPLAQQGFGARIATEALRRAQLLAELEAEHEILRARRERAAADLIDRVLPDPTVPKGER
jgi:hypothetical protein